jgi:5-methylcytosine-specific restriction endonuclease McrBC regulatory subunit McrC
LNPFTYDQLADFYTQTILNSLADEKAPDFKANPRTGEGIATADELRYRQDFLDLLGDLYKNIKQIETNKETTSDDKIRKQEILINDFVKQAQTLAKDSLTKMYEKGTEQAITKLGKLNIKAKAPAIPPKTLTKLMAWQEFAIEKIGTTILLNLKNARYKKDYFGEAYG